MGFMKLEIIKKGRLYGADCTRCGLTHYVHEWATDDFNNQLDYLQNGASGHFQAAACLECSAPLGDVLYLGRQYAGRFSAPGYLDCTEWHYSRNKKTLARELRDMYGD
jgi:hypothetical protein